MSDKERGRGGERRRGERRGEEGKGGEAERGEEERRTYLEWGQFMMTKLSTSSGCFCATVLRTRDYVQPPVKESGLEPAAIIAPES